MPWNRRCLVVGLLALAQAGVIGVLAQGWLKGNAASTPPASCCASEKGDGTKDAAAPKPLDGKEECKKIAPTRCEIPTPVVPSPPVPPLPPVAPEVDKVPMAAAVTEPPPVPVSPLPPPGDGLAAAGPPAPPAIPPSPTLTKDLAPAGPPDAQVAVGPPSPPPVTPGAVSPADHSPAPVPAMAEPAGTVVPPPSPKLPKSVESAGSEPAPPPPLPQEKAKPQADLVPPPAPDFHPHPTEPKLPQAATPPTDSLPTKHIKDKEAELPPAPPSGPEPRLIAQPVGPCPWTLHIHILKGRTQMEARIDKTVKFRVTCEHLDLQAPRGSIQAQGDVKVLGPDLDGKCDRLTINWQDEQVLLDGAVNLKCRKEGQEVELKAEKLSLKLSQISPPETPMPPVSEDGKPAKHEASEKPAAEKKDSASSGNDMLDHP